MSDPIHRSPTGSFTSPTDTRSAFASEGGSSSGSGIAANSTGGGVFNPVIPGSGGKTFITRNPGDPVPESWLIAPDEGHQHDSAARPSPSTSGGSQTLQSGPEEID